MTARPHLALVAEGRKGRPMSDSEGTERPHDEHGLSRRAMLRLGLLAASAIRAPRGAGLRVGYRA
jgi:hypothetical protein